MKVHAVIPDKLYMCEFPRSETDWEQVSKYADTVFCLSKKKSERPGVNVYYTPIPDGRYVDPRQLSQIIKLAMTEIHAGRSVLVHCLGCRNRAPFIAALIYRELTGDSGHAALLAIRRHKPHAVVNPTFVAYLEALL